MHSGPHDESELAEGFKSDTELIQRLAMNHDVHIDPTWYGFAIDA